MIKQKFLSVILTCIAFLSIAVAQRLISNETSSNASYSYSTSKMSYEEVFTTENYTIIPTMPSAFIMLTEPKEPLFVGDSFKISYYADFYQDIKWESSNTDIAEVDNEGKVTLRGAGEVTITATVSSKYFYSETKSDSVTFTVTSLEPITALKKLTIHRVCFSFFSLYSANLCSKIRTRRDTKQALKNFIKITGSS